MARIVETDNFGRDYPNEKFLLWPMTEEACQEVADALNRWAGPRAQRYYKVVDSDHVLAPYFKP